MLYIVATPIGNLKDISERAIETLKGVDFVLCEDTRHSSNLLNHFEIKTPLISYHQHSKLQKIDYIISLLKEGKNLALITDAGTPGISDPGNKLVEEVVKCLGEQVRIEPIPGPSAVTCALSASGMPADKFLFLGFPPAKKGRNKFFNEVLSSKHTVVFYESCHRILRTLEELSKVRADLGVCHSERSEESLQVVVARELTKKFETIYRGTLQEVVKKIECDKVGSSVKGEFVVAVHQGR